MYGFSGSGMMGAFLLSSWAVRGSDESENAVEDGARYFALGVGGGGRCGDFIFRAAREGWLVLLGAGASFVKPVGWGSFTCLGSDTSISLSL